MHDSLGALNEAHVGVIRKKLRLKSTLEFCYFAKIFSPYEGDLVGI